MHARPITCVGLVLALVSFVPSAVAQAVDRLSPPPPVDCAAAFSRALNDYFRSGIFTLSLTKQGWALGGNPPSPQVTPGTLLNLEEQRQCERDELYPYLIKRPPEIVALINDGKLIVGRDGLRVATAPTSPPQPPPPTEPSKREQPPQAPEAGRTASPPAPAPPAAKVEPPSSYPSLWTFIADTVIMACLLLLVSGLGWGALKVTKGAQDLLEKVIRKGDEIWNTLNSLNNFSELALKDLAAVRKTLDSVNASLARSSATPDERRGADRQSARSFASQTALPRSPTKDQLIASCNLALSDRPGAIEEFGQWCDPRAYERVPGKPEELRAEPSLSFDQSYFWFVELEGRRSGWLFPGFGIPLEYGRLMADDAGPLRKILDGIFKWEHGSEFSVVAPADVTRDSSGRLRVQRPGQVIAPLR